MPDLCLTRAVPGVRRLLGRPLIEGADLGSLDSYPVAADPLESPVSIGDHGGISGSVEAVGHEHGEGRERFSLPINS